MIAIYYCHNRSPLAFFDLENIIDSLPNEVSSKVKSFKKWSDANAYLFGKLLLMKGLDEFGEKKTLVDLKYTQYNRPYFEDTCLDFNISHSGDFVVCAISNEGSVGVDIEEIRSIEIDDFQDQFQDSEWQKIICSANMYETFFTYWTQKEAAVKADGRGLSIQLNRVYVNDTFDKVFIENNKFYSYEIFLSNNIKCTLAAKNELRHIKLIACCY